MEWLQGRENPQVLEILIPFFFWEGSPVYIKIENSYWLSSGQGMVRGYCLSGDGVTVRMRKPSDFGDFNSIFFLRRLSWAQGGVWGFGDFNFNFFLGRLSWENPQVLGILIQFFFLRRLSWAQGGVWVKRRCFARCVWEWQDVHDVAI